MDSNGVEVLDNYIIYLIDGATLTLRCNELPRTIVVCTEYITNY